MGTHVGVLPAGSGFADRRDAGRRLARALAESNALGADDRLVVVGLARGGVEVAAEVAAALHAPLDALAVRKVGHPWQPEYGIGAVAPGGVSYVRSNDGLTEIELAEAVRTAAEKAAALDARLHERSAPASVAGAMCVLVDDGLATGGTMTAAVRWARANGARRVVVAVPVGSADAVGRLERDADVDAIVCLAAPRDFGAVGFWYRDFRQVSDEQVVELLASDVTPAHATSAAVVEIDDLRLPADLTLPSGAIGWVVFAHGSGSSRRSPRNVQVARELNRAGIATMLFDLLTHEEAGDRRNVFDVELLAQRLVGATRWLLGRREADTLPVGYFGASTGAAAALLAAAELEDEVSAVVSRGGRPDLAGDRLAAVRAPTLLIVGASDHAVLALNRNAAAQLTCRNELAVVPGATHLFEEPGALGQVSALAADWFVDAFRSIGRESRTEEGAR